MFKLTIRDLLWLTVVVALGLGFYAQRDLLEGAQRREALASYRLGWVDNELRQKGYDLRWDDESGTIGFYYIEPPLLPATRPPHPPDGD